LSTSPQFPQRRVRQVSHVASAEDIHTPVENSEDESPKPKTSGKPEEKPPGQFVTDELEEQTARFLEQVKGLARRRRETEAEEQAKGGPPPPDPDQRSRRL
jgi:hypothetical protein